MLQTDILCRSCRDFYDDKIGRKPIDYNKQLFIELDAVTGISASFPLPSFSIIVELKGATDSFGASLAQFCVPLKPSLLFDLPERFSNTVRKYEKRI